MLQSSIYKYITRINFLGYSKVTTNIILKDMKSKHKKPITIVLKISIQTGKQINLTASNNKRAKRQIKIFGPWIIYFLLWIKRLYFSEIQ